MSLARLPIGSINYPPRKSNCIEHPYERGMFISINNYKTHTETIYQSLKKQYQNSKSGAVKASIQKKMNQLYVQLPEGIHEEVLYQDNRTIKKYIVSKGGEVTIYKMVMYSWGTTYYFKNGVAITKLRFDADTRY